MKNKIIDYPLPLIHNVSSLLPGFNLLRIYSILKKVNHNTHQWVDTGDTAVCMRCDCTYASHPSEWPCGYPVPRSSDI